MAFIGLKFPLCDSEYGYFNPSSLPEEQIETNIRNLLLTEFGERIMVPTYCTALRIKLFEQKELVFQNISNEIQNAIKI